MIGSTNVEIKHITFDSRAVKKDSLFIAVKGVLADGHAFIDKAIAAGAVAIVCEKIPGKTKIGISYIKVENSHYALGVIADNFYGNPSQHIKLIGVTGTNGKTTVATLLYRLFTEIGHKCGLLSTVENKIAGEHIDATHTTPDAISINILLCQMLEKDCKYCFMEVSSHAIHQRRIAGLTFSGGIFTNITHDHLDYHKTFGEYLKAKKMFFDDLPSPAFALYNKDDKNGKVMVQNTKARKYAYALRTMADFKAKIVENQFSGLHLQIDGNEVFTKLIGTFNAYNLLAVYGAASLLGFESIEILTALSKLKPVAGRFQYIRTEKNISAIVDYAHTPDALKNVLITITDIRTNNENVISLVGCGGNRDKAKRPLMAQIACKYSNKVILTSDNPRDEDPQTIIDEMKAGLDSVTKNKVLSILDRKEAIKVACQLAQSDDIILIAGKGHEKYQEIKGVKHPFDEMKILEETLKTVEN